MYWKKSYEANWIRYILLFHAGWKDPKGCMERNISYEDNHTVWRQKKRITVHCNSWPIAGAWKDSRKKWSKIITHACEMGNKYYLKGLFTQIIVHSKLWPRSEMMRPFLETRCCCRPNFNFCFYKVNLRKPNKIYIYEISKNYRL